VTRGPKAYYFFGSRMAASASLPPGPFLPDSFAFFCQRCGELWARVLVEGSEADWRVETVPCAKHAGANAIDWSRIPGSLSQGMYQRDISVLSRARAFDCLPLAIQNLEVLHFINHLERGANAQE